MKEIKGIPLLIRYLKDRFSVICLYLITAGTFLILLNLNQLTYFSQLFYGVILTSFLFICWGLYDFFQYAKSLRMLWDVYANTVDIGGRLPRQKSLPDELYAQIIWKQEEQRKKESSKRDLKEVEMRDYYSMWAHQIKTPIQAIKLLLSREELNSTTLGFSIREELFKTEQYVEMVLYYLRLESISEDVILKEYDLYEILKQSVKKYSVLFINSRLSLKLPPFHIKVLTDEKWLAFCLEQLLSNAIKYTPAGSISIYPDEEKKEEIQKMENNQIQAVLVIEDTGIGIRPEDLPRVFERGFTGYNGRMDKKSTGIGLYLCRQVLKRLSHQIKISSQTEQGTKVWIVFYGGNENLSKV